jgi:hypothetical protein
MPSLTFRARFVFAVSISYLNDNPSNVSSTKEVAQ